MTPAIEKAITEWKEKVYDRGSEIDPNDEEDWRSMAIGFGFGKGFNFGEVYVFVTELDKRRLY